MSQLKSKIRTSSGPRPTETGPYCHQDRDARREQRLVLDSLGSLQRTHYCGNLRTADADKDIVLMGWVHRRRDLGNLIFIDLRERTGPVQIVFNKEQHAAAHARAQELQAEIVGGITGSAVEMQKANPDRASGE